MRSGYSRVFWGLLVVVLGLSINEFDLLLDGVGYLIIAGGCSRLSSLSPRFSAARTLCFVLALLWLAGLIIPAGVDLLLGIVETAVDCTFMWQFLGGIADHAMAHRRNRVATQAHHLRIAYVGILVGVTRVPLAVNRTGDAAGLGVVFAVAVVVVMVMILYLIHRMGIEFAA